MLLNGITTALPIVSLFYREWGETTSEFSAAATVAGELGLRVYLGPAYRSGGLVVEVDERIVPEFDEARGLRGLEEAIAFCHAYEDAARPGAHDAGARSHRDLHSGTAAAHR